MQLAGLSMRWPSFNSLKSSSTGMPGYGEPPSVKISQRRTPKDQLQGSEDKRPVTPGPLLLQPCTRTHHQWARGEGTRISKTPGLYCWPNEGINYSLGGPGS